MNEGFLAESARSYSPFFYYSPPPTAVCCYYHIITYQASESGSGHAADAVYGTQLLCYLLDNDL